jgi:PTH1 family peptidyl-tRNA hydrolase
MPLYTLGAAKNLLIVGLGNPGDEYDGTRHNVGFMCLDDFAAANEFDPWINKKDLKCLFTQKNLGQTRVMLIKPTTFMNLSGEAVQAVSRFYKISPDKIVAVYDELDVPFGQIRMRIGGSAAGHNGVKSLIQHMGEEFGRVRIGIGPKMPEQMDSADFVLATFSKDEQDRVKDLTRETTAILTEVIYGGQLAHETRTF